MGYLRHLIASNNFDPEAFVPFVLDGKHVGWISREFRQRLLDEPVFVERPGSISLRPDISGFEQRTAALMEVVQKLHAEEMIPLIMNEPYPVTDCCRDDPLCLIDRPAAARFGIRSYGQHVNGFVHTPKGIMMWIGKRAQDRGICPGQLDQLVAGGLPYGISLDENLRKECYEEAGIDEELEAYNPLIPDGGNWKATFMIEEPDVEKRRDLLAELIGIEDRVWVRINGHDPVYAIADEDLERADETKTSAVHFMRFELPAEQVEALKGGAQLAAGIDHPNYQVRISPVADNIRASLLGDLD